MYENSTQVLSLRIEILRIVEIYIENSQITSIIVLIFLKAIITLTNTNEKKQNQKNESKINSMQKDSKSKDIYLNKISRKDVITSNEGIFIGTMKKMIDKYSHYIDLYTNILQILFTLTSNVDEKSLVYHIIFLQTF